MQKKLTCYTLAGILFVSIVGTLLHFTYEWSWQNFFAALISPVNESTWEHIKMLFFPMLFYSIFEASRLKTDWPGIFCANAAGILTGVVLIPVIFYTYTGILGTNYLAADILTFLISVIAAFLASYRLTLLFSKSSLHPLLCFLLEGCVWLLMLCFFVFTFYPPAIALFISPQAHS